MINIKKTLAFILVLVSTVAAAQVNNLTTLYIDLDKDLINDIVIFDKENGVIICKLSTQQFKAIKSKDFEHENNAGIRTTRSGFELSISYMRADYACQFR